MLFKEMVAVYFDSHTKLINKLVIKACGTRTTAVLDFEWLKWTKKESVCARELLSSILKVPASNLGHVPVILTEDFMIFALTVCI